MYAWIWPRQLAIVGFLLVVVMQIFWPLSPGRHEIDEPYFWMLHHWGSPMALTVSKGAIRFLQLLPRSHFFSDWINVNAFHAFFSDLEMVFWPYCFWLNLTALVIWMAWFIILMWFSLFFLRIVRVWPRRSFIRMVSLHSQPWDQAQRWPIWRRSLGLIPLLTLVWACTSSLFLAPVFAGVWVSMGFLLWWPFFGS